MGLTSRAALINRYLIRIPPGWTPEEGERDPNQTPVVFFHGLGFGLVRALPCASLTYLAAEPSSYQETTDSAAAAPSDRTSPTAHYTVHLQ